MDNQVDVASSEWFRFYTVDPPTLRKLASQELAAMNCRYQFKSHCYNNMYRLDDFDGELFVISSQLEIDRDYLDKILESSVLCLVNKAIETWIFYNVRYIYDDLDPEPNILNCLDDLVLKPDGTICYLSTAENLLNGNKLSPLQKYKLACINCLVDDVRKLWPLVLNDRRLITYVTRTDPLFVYWTNLMMGESEQLSGNNFESIERRREIFESSKWPAIEYFFDMLTVAEQVEAAVLILRNDNENIIERLFLKANKNEEFRHRLLTEVTFKMIVFDRKYWYFSISHLWNFIKYIITGEDFCDAIDVFIRNLWYEDLFEMWTTAPDHLKKFVLSDMNTVERIFDILKNTVFRSRYRSYYKYYSDMRFFSALLNDLKFESRNYLWRKYWHCLVAISRPKFLEEVMKMCFNTDNELLQFKEREMMDISNIKECAAVLIKFGYIGELTDFISFCSINADRVSAFKREILSSFDYFDTCWTLVNYSKFIDSAFTNEVDARNYKIAKLRSNACLRYEYYNSADKSKLGIPWE